MTERQKYYFAVKERGDGTPWICLEPMRGNLPVLEKGFLGFDLPLGTTLKQAEKIANILQDTIINISYTEIK